MYRREFARMVDISAVRAQSTKAEVDMIIDAAKKYGFVCVFGLNGFTPYIVRRLEDRPDIAVGGVVGFPSGGESTAAKCFQADEMQKCGCGEIDMVMNVGRLKSGMFADVRADIAAVRKAVEKPLKVIVEAPLLDEAELAAAARIVLESGADFVKTGTGWAGATTLRHVEVIKNAVGDGIKIKVAGGVRDVETVESMRALGVSRFGIGYSSALKIIESL